MTAFLAAARVIFQFLKAGVSYSSAGFDSAVAFLDNCWLWGVLPAVYRNPIPVVLVLSQYQIYRPHYLLEPGWPASLNRTYLIEPHWDHWGRIIEIKIPTQKCFNNNVWTFWFLLISDSLIETGFCIGFFAGANFFPYQWLMRFQSWWCGSHHSASVARLLSFLHSGLSFICSCDATIYVTCSTESFWCSTHQWLIVFQFACKDVSQDQVERTSRQKLTHISASWSVNLVHILSRFYDLAPKCALSPPAWLSGSPPHRVSETIGQWKSTNSKHISCRNCRGSISQLATFLVHRPDPQGTPWTAILLNLCELLWHHILI